MQMHVISAWEKTLRLSVDIFQSLAIQAEPTLGTLPHLWSCRNWMVVFASRLLRDVWFTFILKCVWTIYYISHLSSFYFLQAFELTDKDTFVIVTTSRQEIHDNRTYGKYFYVIIKTYRETETWNCVKINRYLE